MKQRPLEEDAGPDDHPDCAAARSHVVPYHPR